MFTAESIPHLIHLLEKRNVYLYHACQYQDFCAYLALGGIPSRQRMEQNHRSLTPFATDATDKENGVWDKIFFNLDDFGKAFARGRNATPNAYGPILFRFKPAALAEAIDVAICLRSAGARGFKRDEEALPSIADVNALFYYPPDHKYGAAYLKFGEQLQKRFGSKAQAVEMSCTLPEGILSFKNLSDIIVDPYRFEGINLRKIVEYRAYKAGLVTTIWKRQPNVDSKLYNSLLRAVRNNLQSPSAFAQLTSSQFLKNWAIHIEKTGGLLLKNYQRYLAYLHVGTVLPIDKLLDEPNIGREIDWLSDFNDDYNLYYDDDNYLYYDEHEDKEFDDEYDNDDYFVTEKALQGFADHSVLKDDVDILLDELDDDGMRWAEAEDSGWFYGDEDDIYDDIHSTLRRF